MVTATMPMAQMSTDGPTRAEWPRTCSGAM
jgi:hypothetical protein